MVLAYTAGGTMLIISLKHIDGTIHRNTIIHARKDARIPNGKPIIEPNSAPLRSKFIVYMTPLIYKA
jgi:hypothetical protein